MNILISIGLTGVMMAQAPQVDMQAVAKWSNVKVVRYHIEGVYEGWTAVSHQDPSSQGDVTDRLVVDVDWSMRERKTVGAPKLQNAKSTVKAVRNLGKPCPAPELQGDYDRFEAKEVETDGQDRLTVKGLRSFPVAKIGLECPASLALKPSPAKQQPVTEYLALPNASVSTDRKSFILKANGWTWTYVPSVVQ